MKLHWKAMSALALIGLMIAYVMLAPHRPGREPFGGPDLEAKCVMVIDHTTTKYSLAPPYRVIRDGRISLSRPSEAPTLPVIRLDMMFNGEHVILFTRVQAPMPAESD
jgi:hypothetical protein